MDLAAFILRRCEGPPPMRPGWQRVALPLVGAVAVVLGVVGWILPVIPGLPLALLGLPWLFCCSHSSEDWLRRRMRRAALWWLARRARRRGDGA